MLLHVLDFGLSLVCLTADASLAHSQEATSPSAVEAPAQADAQPPDRVALEAAFSELLTGATLAGSFTDDSAPDRAPQSERYVILAAKKVAGDQWGIESRIEFGGKSLVVPIKLDVLWAIAPRP